MEQQVSILEWFLKDHVTLKSGIMMRKFQLFRNNSYFKFFEYFIILLFYYIFGQINVNLNLHVAKYGDTRNSCSAFYLSLDTHTQQWTHTHTMNTHHEHTHTEQWAAAPGEQSGVRCLAQGSHLSRGIEGGENTRYPLSHRQLLPDLRFEPTTSGYKADALSIRPLLPHKYNLGCGKPF